MKQRFLLPVIISLLHIPILFITIGKGPLPQVPKKKIRVTTICLLENPLPKALEQSVQTIAPPKKTPPFPPLIKPKKRVSKEKLQKQLKQSIAKSKSTPVAKGQPLKKIVKNDAGNAQREYNDYLHSIFEILSDSLTLPEQGKVKLAITVGGDGKVVKIETLLSKSALNLSYLQQNVINLQFPKYTKKEDRTFTILFSDEK
jgi:outer membrane biosynthesis protein TonB